MVSYEVSRPITLFGANNGALLPSRRPERYRNNVAHLRVYCSYEPNFIVACTKMDDEGFQNQTRGIEIIEYIELNIQKKI